MDGLEYILSFVEFLPVIAGMISYRFLKSDMRIAFLFLSFIAIIELIATELGHHHIHNLWLHKCESLVEALVFFYLFSQWYGVLRLRKVWTVFSLIYFLAWIVPTQLNRVIEGYYFNENCIKSIIWIALYGALLLKLQHDYAQPVFRDHRFWFSAGIFFYNSLSLVYYLMISTKVVLEDKVLLRQIWFINFWANIVAYLLFTYSFLCIYKKRTSHISS